MKSSLNCESEISNICNAVEGHCFQAMRTMRHYANGSFDWLLSGHRSVNPSREAISTLSGKYKRFTFVHHVPLYLLFTIKKDSYHQTFVDQTKEIGSDC